MNNKMAINTHLSTTEPKNKLNKPEEQKQYHRQRTFWWLPDGKGSGDLQKGEELRITNC